MQNITQLSYFDSELDCIVRISLLSFEWDPQSEANEPVKGVALNYQNVFATILFRFRWRSLISCDCIGWIGCRLWSNSQNESYHLAIWSRLSIEITRHTNSSNIWSRHEGEKTVVDLSSTSILPSANDTLIPPNVRLLPHLNFSKLSQLTDWENSFSVDELSERI